jgi:hypothetical protein
MFISLVIPVLLFLFGAFVIVLGVAFLIMQGLDQVESIKKRVPWLTRALDKRESLVVLLLLAIVLLIGNGYELLIKEVPGVPSAPNVTIKAPSPPVESATPPVPAKGQPAKAVEIPPSSTGPAVPPPVLTGIRIASQKRIPSDDPNLPFGLEVVIQTDATPTWTPAQPIVVDLYSATAINATSVQRF